MRDSMNESQTKTSFDDEAAAKRGECVWRETEMGVVCITRNCQQHNPKGYARMMGWGVDDDR